MPDDERIEENRRYNSNPADLAKEDADEARKADAKAAREAKAAERAAEKKA